MLSVTEFAALGLVLCFISSYVPPPTVLTAPFAGNFNYLGSVHLSTCLYSSVRPLRVSL